MKATFFLGRIHHAHKLLGVAERLQNAGTEIDFIVSDNSINIDPTTEYLHRFGITEYHHTKDYMGGYEYSGTGINEELFAHFPPFWVLSSYSEAMQCLYGFAKYLDEAEPDLVFALHENNFWVRILFYLAKERNIRTYSLQEGIILKREEEVLKKYSNGTDYTDVVFSWSKHDKDFFSNASKIVPTGPSHMDAWVRLVNDKTQCHAFKNGLRAHLGMANRPILVFAPPRLDLYHGDFVKAVRSLAKWTMNNGIGMIVKLHPFQQGMQDVKSLVSEYSHVLVNKESDSLQFVVLADVLVTQTSTIAVEAAILETPVIELDMDYIGLDQTIHQHGGAVLLEGDNFDAIKTLLNSEVGHKFARKYFPLADGKSAQRIADYIKAGLWVS